MAWAAAIILPIDDFGATNTEFVVTLVAAARVLFIFIPLVVYFNVSVYEEVRRNEKQITPNQVFLEAKEKLQIGVIATVEQGKTGWPRK